MVASWMFPVEMGLSPISLAFTFVILEVSCFIWSCISLYYILFSVVVSFMADVAWLLWCDCSLVLISSWCVIDAWFLSTKLFLLNVRLRLLLLLFLCICFAITSSYGWCIWLLVWWFWTKCSRWCVFFFDEIIFSRLPWRKL